MESDRLSIRRKKAEDEEHKGKHWTHREQDREL